MGCICFRGRIERDECWKTFGALICLRIRDNVWVYGSKEERKVKRGKGYRR
jgi:hypothetical protein